MSRSYRHHNIIGLCGGKRSSEKFDKRITNKGLRHKSKIILGTKEHDNISHSDFPTKDDIRDRYNFNKDGCILVDFKDKELWNNFHFTKEGKLRK